MSDQIAIFGFLCAWGGVFVGGLVGGEVGKLLLRRSEMSHEREMYRLKRGDVKDRTEGQ
jgi:Na+/glutamate symporter